MLCICGICSGIADPSCTYVTILTLVILGQTVWPFVEVPTTGKHRRPALGTDGCGWPFFPYVPSSQIYVNKCRHKLRTGNPTKLYPLPTAAVTCHKSTYVGKFLCTSWILPVSHASWQNERCRVLTENEFDYSTVMSIILVAIMLMILMCWWPG